MAGQVEEVRGSGSRRSRHATPPGHSDQNLPDDEELGPLIEKKQETRHGRRSRKDDEDADARDDEDEKLGFAVMSQTIQMTISGSIGYILDYAQDFISILFLSFAHSVAKSESKDAK